MSGEPRYGLRGSIVVTGGTSGIGEATILACAEERVAVAVLGRNVEKATRVAQAAIQLGAPDAVGIKCDVRDEGSVAAAISAAAKRLGPIHGLVTSSGIGDGGLVHELSLERWEDVLTTNLTGTFLACKHALIHMLGHGEGGAIVCASSPWAYVSAPGGASAYSASKGGICALVRSLALDYAPYSIRVNTIIPGATETPLMWAGMSSSEIPAARERIGKQLVVGRLAEPAEIAPGILWLLSDAASYTTGSELVIDGGLMARASIES